MAQGSLWKKRTRQPHRAGPTLGLLLELTVYAGGASLLCLALIVVLRGEIRIAQATEQLPDMQLWSEEAKARYLAAPRADEQTLLGVLRAPAIALEVPVYNSATDLHLDRGAGVIDGMAYPHEPGHIGIAGHRDGYFRAFKDIELGDHIELETLQGLKRFVVDDLRIIEPTELAYLQETDQQRLTIVTCYPFYFAGSAPQRFLVRARPTETELKVGSNTSGETP